MNFKDILVVSGLFLIMTWGVERFVLSRYRDQADEQIKSGQTFTAPQSKQIIRPLNTEVDFFDQEAVSPAVLTELETEWGHVAFSSEGAALERLEFKHGQAADNIVTIQPALEREHKPFLVALDNKTPYYFKLANKTEDQDHIILTYEGSFGDGRLIKTFTIAKKVHRIDLNIQVVPEHVLGNTQLRIFYPAPSMPELKNDVVSAIMSNAKGSVEKVAISGLQLHEGWWSPAIFGAENKYFSHALIADKDHFVERAYYMLTPEKKLIAILESAELVNGSDAKQSSLSFYFGPKDVQAMAVVEPKLEQTLGYAGILAPLCNLLLKLLEFLYSFVHNYGLAIILLTVLIKLVFLPFTLSSERSMKKSNDMSKKLKHIQNKYKNDPERMRSEQAELIKKYGMPQLAGCLPMLMQLPIFIALSQVLSNSTQLYKAPFVGWIHDLSAPDPYYILPFFIASAMIIQALMGDPKQRMMMLSTALVFGAVSINFSAGLVIYICASTILALLQSVVQKVLKVA